MRTFGRSPGFTLVAVTCLALGIGVNATIFSVVDGVLLRPYPYPDPDSLVVLNATNHRLGVTRTGLSYQDFRDSRDENGTFSAMAAFTQRSLAIADGRTDPERYDGLTVSWNLFGILGTPPALGRDFRPEDDMPGGRASRAGESDDVWRRRYDGDPSIVGRAILVNAAPHTVIGVMRPAFHVPRDAAPVGSDRAVPARFTPPGRPAERVSDR